MLFGTEEIIMTQQLPKSTPPNSYVIQPPQYAQTVQPQAEPQVPQPTTTVVTVHSERGCLSMIGIVTVVLVTMVGGCFAITIGFPILLGILGALMR